MTITVVVCTIPERWQLLGRCLWHLQNQSTDKFDVIVAHGSRRGKGDKLNKAFSLATTSHVMVCDDDDYLALHAVETLLPHSEDFVGFDAVQTVHGRYAETIHQEVASHICPIRTDLARLFPFGNEYLADVKWTKAVKPFCRTTAYVGQPLYFYDKWVKGGGWSPTREVGWWPYDKLRFNWI